MSKQPLYKWKEGDENPEAHRTIQKIHTVTDEFNLADMYKFMSEVRATIALKKEQADTIEADPTKYAMDKAAEFRGEETYWEEQLALNEAEVAKAEAALGIKNE